MSKKKKGLIIGAVVLVILALVYAAGIYLFQIYTYPNTSLKGADISLIKIESLPTLLEDVDIEVEGRDGEKVVLKGKELGLIEEFEALDKIQEPTFTWPLEVFRSHHMDDYVKRTVNEEQLQAGLESSAFFQERQAPQDAEIVLTEDSLHIEEEVMGNTLDLAALKKTVETAFLQGDSEIELEEEYLNPSVLAQDLEPEIEHLQGMLDVQLSLLVAGEKEEVPKLTRFLDESLEINLEKVKEYVMEIKTKYDNVGKERDFKTSSGETIKVSGGIFGVQINRDKTVEKIIAAFESEESQEVEAEYTRTALNYGKIGGDYIELSIARQKMWLYRNGELLVETPVVTGNISEGYRTPPGVWEVWVKETNRRLRGKNKDGSKYDVPVKYWMQVDYTGIGIHDTYYRSAYGGQIYRTDGSHGCINTPLNKVSQIYDNTPMGTPMIIY